MNGRNSHGRLGKVARLTLCATALLLFLVPSYVQAKKPNYVNATEVESNIVQVDWGAKAHGGSVSVHFHAAAVFEGRLLKYDNFWVYDLESGEWFFGWSGPTSTSLAQQAGFPPGTVVTIWMVIFGKSPRAKTLTTTLTIT